MKEALYKLLPFFVALLLVYVILFFFTFLSLNSKLVGHFKSVEQVNFHKKYSSKLHHIRDQFGLNLFYKKDDVEDLLFTRLNRPKTKKLTILLQGDSWIDQITSSSDKNFPSLKMLQNYGNNKKIEFISGGISSFSPSLMNLQLEILEKDFNIYPDVIIAYIDQFDVGDENCRYKKKKIFENGKLIAVKPESYNNTLWDYTKPYVLTKIFKSYNSKFFITLHTLNFELRYGLIIVVKKIKNKLKKTTNTECHIKKIQNYSMNPKVDDVNYFSSTIINYLDEIEKKKHIKKIFLVTFPHRAHFVKKGKKINYGLNVSDVVDQVIKEKKEITHINFSKLVQEIFSQESNFNPNNIFQKDNIHLNSVSHAKIFINKILIELDKFFINN